MHEGIIFNWHVHPIHIFLHQPLLFYFRLGARAAALDLCILVGDPFLPFRFSLEDYTILFVPFEDHASCRWFQSQNLRSSFDGKSFMAHMIDNLQSCLVAYEAVLQSFLSFAHEFRRKYYTLCEKVLHLYWSKGICSNSQIHKYLNVQLIQQAFSKHWQSLISLIFFHICRFK